MKEGSDKENGKKGFLAGSIFWPESLFGKILLILVLLIAASTIYFLWRMKRDKEKEDEKEDEFYDEDEF